MGNTGRVIIMDKYYKIYEEYKDILKRCHELLNTSKKYGTIQLIVKRDIRKVRKNIKESWVKGHFSDEQFEELMEINKDDID